MILENLSAARSLDLTPKLKGDVNNMKLSDKAYDILKWIVVIVLPALATLYAALGGIWGLPLVTEITGTITALTTFLGAILMISTANYNKNAEK